MLCIKDCYINVGTQIMLSKSWVDMLTSYSMFSNYSCEYTVKHIYDLDERLYICESNNPKQPNRIALTEFVAQYLIASKVKATNVGHSFFEYLPTSGTKILITSSTNPSEVIPAVFRVQPGLVFIENQSLVSLTFYIDFLYSLGFTSLKYFINSEKQYTWKFLFNKDTSHMTDYEKMFQETMIHKEYVTRSCKKLARYLESFGAYKHAEMLRQRSYVHDNSKIQNEKELRALASIINDKSSMLDPTVKITPLIQNAIKIHWENNSHHPEHYKSVTDMTRIDVMEMCCDWHARSMQYKTNFLEFVRQRQNERFHFPDWMFAEIWHYCTILDSHQDGGG